MFKAEKRNCPLGVWVNIGRAKLYRTCGIFENFLKVRRQKVLGTCGRSIKVQTDFFVWTLGQVRKNKQGSRDIIPCKMPYCEALLNNMAIEYSLID